MVPMSDGLPQPRLLAAAKRGDQAAFEELVAHHRRELYAHCYRMLGSVQDAEDALQESLIGAWRGLAGFEGRSSLRTWLYRITTNACLRLIARNPRRILSPEYGPPRRDTSDLGEPVSAAEVADFLDTSPASVNSALQRARKTVEERVPDMSQRAELDALGDDGQRELVNAFVSAWWRADVPALLDLLAEDARFTMPPLPAWFDGRDNVERFFTERVFATPWRLVPLRANGQLGFACYILQPGADRFRLGAINLLRVREGQIAEINGFLEPGLHAALGQ